MRCMFTVQKKMDEDNQNIYRFTKGGFCCAKTDKEVEFK